MTNQATNQPIAGVDTAQRFSKIPTISLLNAVWRSQDREHFISVLDKATRRFRNIPVSSAEEAANFATAYSAIGLDTYFAFAEYANADSRKSENAVGASAFVVDIDVCPERAATGMPGRYRFGSPVARRPESLP